MYFPKGFSLKFIVQHLKQAKSELGCPPPCYCRQLRDVGSQRCHGLQLLEYCLNSGPRRSQEVGEVRAPTSDAFFYFLSVRSKLTVTSRTSSRNSRKKLRAFKKNKKNKKRDKTAQLNKFSYTRLENIHTQTSTATGPN